MADNLTIQVGVDNTQLRAGLEISKQLLSQKAKEMSLAAKDAIVTGDKTHLLEVSAGYNSILATTKAQKAELVGVNHEHRTLAHLLREQGETLERMRGQFRGGIEGLVGANAPITAKGLGVGLAIAGVGELFKLASETMEKGHHIEVFSSALGISTGEMRAWQKAAGGAAVDADLFGRAMEKLAVNADKAYEAQKKLRVETAQKIAGEDQGLSLGIEARGGRNTPPPKRSAQFIDGTMLMSTDDPKFRSYIGEQYKLFGKAREDAIERGQHPPPLPPFESFLYSRRDEMAQLNKHGEELRQAYRKDDPTAKVPFGSYKEALETQKPEFFDNAFSKHNIQLIDEQTGKMREYRDVVKDVRKEFIHLGEGPELTAFSKKMFDKLGLDPLLPHMMKSEKFGEALDTRPHEDLDVEALSRGHAWQKQKEAELADLALTGGAKTVEAAQGIVEGLKRLSEAAQRAKTDVGEVYHLSEVPLTDSGQFNVMIEKLKELGSAALDATRMIGALGGGGDSTMSPATLGGFASGGYIRGPGSGTSDSILARLSNGEYVMSAAAVSRLGVGALNAMNFGRYLPRFAAGGMVGGGSTGGGGTPVHIHLGDKTYETSASPSVAAALAHEARSRLMLRTGAKPSWAGA